MKKILSVLLILILLTSYQISLSESTNTDDNFTNLYVRVKLLNGRAEPSRKAEIESHYDQGDIIIATGNWSDDHKWVEVIGGETGTVWVFAEYVSEYKTHTFVINTQHKKVKIRSKPFNGKVIGYLKRNKTIEVDRLVLGWAKTAKGWIDMRYVEEY